MNGDLFEPAPRLRYIALIYSHDGPIRRRKRGYILLTDQSDAGSVGIFSGRTHQTQEPSANHSLCSHTRYSHTRNSTWCGARSSKASARCPRRMRGSREETNPR
eukprot:7224398-Pyramimonas_sp.AAC.1